MKIMDFIYKLREATAAQVLNKIPEPPIYSTIRALLKILEDKGHITHKQAGPRYVFSPTIPREKAQKRALKHLLHTFFDGSREKAVAALLDISEEKLCKEEWRRLSHLIREAKKEGR